MNSEWREIRIAGGKVTLTITHYPHKSVLNIQGKWDHVRYDRTARVVHRPGNDTLALCRAVIAGDCPLCVLADHLDELNRVQFAPLTDHFLRA